MTDPRYTPLPRHWLAMSDDKGERTDPRWTVGENRDQTGPAATPGDVLASREVTGGTVEYVVMGPPEAFKSILVEVKSDPATQHAYEEHWARPGDCRVCNGADCDPVHLEPPYTTPEMKQPPGYLWCFGTEGRCSGAVREGEGDVIEDRAEPGGSLLELANRPPEEWELARQIGRVRPGDFELRIRTSRGEVGVHPHPLCSDGVWYALTGANAHSFIGAPTVALITAVVVDLADMGQSVNQILLSVRDWAALNAVNP